MDNGENRLHSYLMRWVRDETIAADLTQETFVALLEGARLDNPAYGLDALVFNVGGNRALNFLRNRKAEAKAMKRYAKRVA